MVSLFRRGSTWWVTYQAGSRQVRRSLGTDNRRIALDLKAQVERRLFLGEPEAPEKRSLADYLEEYRGSSRARKRPRTHATDMARLEDFVGAIDSDCLGDVTTADVSRFLDRKVNRDGIGPTTLLRYREILHAFFQHARRLGYVRENPVSPIPRPRLAEREPAFLRQEQVELVLKAVQGSRIHPLVATLIYAGLRREEACWLTKDDLDLAGVTPVLRVRAKSVGGESWMAELFLARLMRCYGPTCRRSCERRPVACQRDLEAFPRERLRVLVIASGGMFAMAMACRPLALEFISPAQLGCLMTLTTAACEWIIVDWRIRVDRLRERMLEGTEERRLAESVHLAQVRSSSYWVHLAFGVGTITWGFG